MNWISKKTPKYFHKDDTWTGESDYQKFKPCIGLNVWISDSGEKVPFAEKSIISNFEE